jgi:protein-tyrosine phosphatase
MCYMNPDDKTPFVRKVINIMDDSSENIFKYFKEAIKYIESSKKIYVHCMAGVSRSPTIVIAYLMWKDKLTFNDAYWKVCNKRKFIYPNEGFRNQLMKFEKLLNEYNWDLNKINFE